MIRLRPILAALALAQPGLVWSGLVLPGAALAQQRVLVVPADAEVLIPPRAALAAQAPAALPPARASVTASLPAWDRPALPAWDRAAVRHLPPFEEHPRMLRAARALLPVAGAVAAAVVLGGGGGGGSGGVSAPARTR